MGLNLWEILVILLIVLIVFGAGRLPQVMGDVAKGVRNFKQGLKDEPTAASAGDTPVSNTTPDTGRRTDA